MGWRQIGHWSGGPNVTAPRKTDSSSDGQKSSFVLEMTSRLNVPPPTCSSSSHMVQFFVNRVDPNFETFYRSPSGKWSPIQTGSILAATMEEYFQRDHITPLGRLTQQRIKHNMIGNYPLQLYLIRLAMVPQLQWLRCTILIYKET